MSGCDSPGSRRSRRGDHNPLGVDHLVEPYPWTVSVLVELEQRDIPVVILSDGAAADLGMRGFRFRHGDEEPAADVHEITDLTELLALLEQE